MPYTPFSLPSNVGVDGESNSFTASFLGFDFILLPGTRCPIVTWPLLNRTTNALYLSNVAPGRRYSLLGLLALFTLPV